MSTNRLETIKSFLKFLLKEDNDMFLNDTGVLIKAWMEANGIGGLTTNPEFHDQFQQIIPIMNDDTINTLTKKLFIYNYYWLVMSPNNSQISTSYLSCLAAMLARADDNNINRLVAQTSAEKALEMLQTYQHNNSNNAQDIVIYSSANDPSITSTSDVLSGKKMNSSPDSCEIIYFESEDSLGVFTPRGSYSFDLGLNGWTPGGNYTMQDILENIPEQAESALKLWATANGYSLN